MTNRAFIHYFRPICGVSTAELLTVWPQALEAATSCAEQRNRTAQRCTRAEAAKIREELPNQPTYIIHFIGIASSSMPSEWSEEWFPFAGPAMMAQRAA